MLGLFSRTFKVVSSKEPLVRECYVEGENSLFSVVSFRRPLRQSEKAQYGELLCLLTIVFICRKDKQLDMETLLFGLGVFSAKAFYLPLEGSPQHRATCAFVWLVLIKSVAVRNRQMTQI